MSNGNTMIVLLIIRLISKTLYKMIQYFPRQYEPFGGANNVKVDLFSYAAKTDLRKATEVDTSELVAKSDLACLKAETDKIDVERLKTVCVDLNKLSDLLNNKGVQKMCMIKWF